MLYYYVVYLLIHIDSISELQSNHLWQLSNTYRTIIKHLRTTFNPNYIHWILRNLNFILPNQNLFEFLNFFFLWTDSRRMIHWRPKCGNSPHTQIINHVFVYLYNATFSILFKAWTIYSYAIIKFLSQILWKKH